jgi:hypothetical protein
MMIFQESLALSTILPQCENFKPTLSDLDIPAYQRSLGNRGTTID